MPPGPVGSLNHRGFRERGPCPVAWRQAPRDSATLFLLPLSSRELLINDISLLQDESSLKLK